MLNIWIVEFKTIHGHMNHSNQSSFAFFANFQSWDKVLHNLHLPLELQRRFFRIYPICNIQLFYLTSTTLEWFSLHSWIESLLLDSQFTGNFSLLWILGLWWRVFKSRKCQLGLCRLGCRRADGKDSMFLQGKVVAIFEGLGWTNPYIGSLKTRVQGLGEPTRTVVPWRQGFRHLKMNKCMG